MNSDRERAGIDTYEVISPKLERFKAPLIWLFKRGLSAWSFWRRVRRREWGKAWRSLTWGALWEETFMTYDAQGRKIEQRERFLGAVETRDVFSYDQRGNLVERRSFDIDGTLSTLEHHEYRFDECGNWIVDTMVRPRLARSIEEVRSVTERAIIYF